MPLALAIPHDELLATGSPPPPPPAGDAVLDFSDAAMTGAAQHWGVD